MRIARSAWLGIEVADLTRASASARLLATSAGGQVTSENVVTATDPTGAYGAGSPGGAAGTGPGVGLGAGPDGATSVFPVGVDQARLTLSVPATALDGVLSELSRLGSVSYRSSSSEDVTDSYVDTKARIGPMRDSVSAVRALLAKATDLQQVITLENELTRRQADLDSLTQRLAQLDRRTTMSDVTATFWTSSTAAAPQSGGVGTALGRAWDGFLASAAVDPHRSRGAAALGRPRPRGRLGRRAVPGPTQPGGGRRVAVIDSLTPDDLTAPSGAASVRAS